MILKKSIALFSALTLVFTMLSCEEDNSADNSVPNYVGLESYYTVELADGETVTAEGRILASETSGTDRTYNLIVDASSNHGAANYSVPATVTIPAGEKEGVYEVTIVGNSLVDGNKIVVRLDTDAALNQNTTYATYSGGVLTGVATSKTTFNLYRPCASTRVKLSITFDSYPDETAWELYDSSFNLVDSGGFDPTGSTITGYVALGFPGSSTFNLTKCLVPDTYTFVIYDAFGDGMYTSATIIGKYSMSNLNDGATFFSAAGDSFDSNAVHEFTIN